MEMHAYSSDYLENAQQNLGNMMDYAVNTCEIEAEQFFNMFLSSGVADEFGKGNPRYLVGMTGCELVKLIAEKSCTDLSYMEEDMYLDKSPEYWSGWALAYYQWITSKTFSHIVTAVPIEEIITMYEMLHEADISKFVSIINEKLHAFYPETNLKRIRTLAGYSQSELAKESGVSLRQIQLLEQRQRDINKTNVESVFRLARTLSCNIENLIE